jgi:alpha-L-fucosidase
VVCLGLTPLLVQADNTPTPASAHPVASIQDSETTQQRDARMAWWREARFGMFIHWGLYAVPAGFWQGKKMGGLGEWIMCSGKIPVSDYQALASQFNPTQFDADAWVAVAKAAGMKYIVITAKHHDGFAMFKSEANPFNIVDATPFKRDPLKELAAACQKQGIKLGFYYSQDQDWTAPGGAALRGHWDKAQHGDFATYLNTKAIPQIKELLTNYGQYPAVLWFDTPTKDMTPELASQIVAVLNQHPNLIWNNRLGGGYKGDTKTPEQHVPPGGFPGEDWETCMTINRTWGYRSDDMGFKSNELLLRNLIDIASKGGNYLLNVGPDATGVIPQPEVDRLKKIGQWLAVNGEAIYGCGPTAFGAEDGAFDPVKKDSKGQPFFNASWDWRCTTKSGKLFIHIFKWPGTSFALSNVKDSITKAYFLADPQHAPLVYTQKGTDVTVSLPEKALDPIATVLVLETK